MKSIFPPSLIMIFVLVLLLCSFTFFPLNNNEEVNKIRTVVIDAGHGGKDPGCSGIFSKEKTIALAIALKLGKYIEQYLPNVKVIYTRKKDVFVELIERANIANTANADVFISVHCNSFPTKKTYGTETYVMGLHRTEDNLNVAKRENASILMEEDYATKYGGFDPNSPESYIILSMFQNAYLDHSINLASKIETQFKERVSRKSRGVHQAGFVVLVYTKMTSVLVETGCLSNKNEEKYLRSQQGQEYIASAIFRAFRNYKNEFEKNGAHINQPAPHSTLSGNVVFKVQFLTSAKLIDTDQTKYNNIPDINIEQIPNGLHKYTAGLYTQLDTAVTLQNQLRQRGFKDAFIVAYKDNKRISMKEAMSLIK